MASCPVIVTRPPSGEDRTRRAASSLAQQVLENFGAESGRGALQGTEGSL